MWPHFSNLLARSWHGVLDALSTSTLSIILFSLATPIVTFVITIIVVSKQHPEKTFVEHLKQSVTPTLIGFLVPLVFLGCVFGWKVVEIVYGDHQMLVAKAYAPKPVCPSCPTIQQPGTGAQPPIVIENKIDTAELAKAIAEIQRQERQAEISQSPLKAQILALSKDMLAFVLERGRLEPPPQVHLTPEVMEKEFQKRVRFDHETQNQYSLKFEGRVASIFVQISSQGIDVDSWPRRCSGSWVGSPTTIQECAGQLSVFADQVHEP